MQPHLIRNFAALSTSAAREDALRILEAGYDSIDPARVLQMNISITGTSVAIREHSFDIASFKNVFLMGFGKGSCAAVSELYTLLQARVKKSVVIDKTMLATCPAEVEAFVGTHPLPSKANVEATKVIVGVAEEAGENDVVLVVVEGGGSALLCSSDEECEQDVRLFEECERVGATIGEMNTVRKHLSSLKGGGLARALYPATVIGLVLSDIVGGHPEEVASGPTYYDASTVDDARTILERYGLEKAFTLQETPKERKYFEKVTNIVLVSNEDSRENMAETARALGYESVVLPEPLYEFPEKALRSIFARAKSGRAIFAGGEVRFKIPKDHGTGGRCQLLALESLPLLGPDDVFVAAASDGSDNSDRAGAIVDRSTADRIKERQIDLADACARADALPVFAETGDEILTGPVSANVSDWYFLLTPPAA